jgi:hypothetical protein
MLYSSGDYGVAGNNGECLDSNGLSAFTIGISVVAENDDRPARGKVQPVVPIDVSVYHLGGSHTGEPGSEGDRPGERMQDDYSQRWRVQQPFRYAELSEACCR